MLFVFDGFFNNFLLLLTQSPRPRCLLTQVVVFVLWSMKKGLPLGALRTSQPVGMKADSLEASGAGESGGVSSGDTVGWDRPAAPCAAASDVLCSRKKKKNTGKVFIRGYWGIS